VQSLTEKTWTLVTEDRTEGSIAVVVMSPAVKSPQFWLEAALLISELTADDISELTLEDVELSSELTLEESELTSELALESALETALDTELVSGVLALTLALALALTPASVLTTAFCANAAPPKLIAAINATRDICRMVNSQRRTLRQMLRGPGEVEGAELASLGQCNDGLAELVACPI